MHHSNQLHQQKMEIPILSRNRHEYELQDKRSQQPDSIENFKTGKTEWR